MKKVLIVDDDLVNQKLLEQILSELDYGINIADNGEKALLYFKNNKNLDIILMDMHMPYLSGLDAVRLIRDIEVKENRNHIPIIAITSFSTEGNKETCLSAGCDDYIAKPFDKEMLIKLINMYNPS